ncbi:phage protein [Acetobacter thailandicus]|uniref:DUF3277 family protein n=1 Tax=Acetobacter thailandicus TaxID=1502842 RepID=A0ABT3QDH2_9PROT|nr:phage protein [Acetobacter thailandicus]MBS1003167.1 DUF3277 family protein [Acetobacter thailandicus]MCX2563314.1 DUF3277 family protein [Acetobacter thailandicus]NHN94068.1 DUF3277 family protein [Acetobacter thailandicus]
MTTGATYSFLDVSCSLVGPGIATTLGNEAGSAEEGISIELQADKNTMTTGADGGYMHSLHAANAGTVTVRLLKTSPQNQILMAAYNAQRISSSLWGKNVITLIQSNADDAIVCTGCAFVRQPNLEYATDGGTNTWTFHSGKITGLLGAYS